MRKTKMCAYCGKEPGVTMDHVIPANLYPKSKADSKVQRRTVPCCVGCQKGFQDDEAHFRNVLLVCGEPNAPARELWSEKVQRGFVEKDGRKRFQDFDEQLRDVVVGGRSRTMVFPEMDARFMRIVRKVVRGLSDYHHVLSAVSDHRVVARVFQDEFPEEILVNMQWPPYEQDILQYGYGVLHQVGIHSFWVLTFFERTTFLAAVSESEEGFLEDDTRASQPAALGS